MGKSKIILGLILTLVVAAGPAVGQTARISTGLTVLYGFQEGAGQTVQDVSQVGSPLNLNIDQPASVNWIPGGGLEVVSPVVLNSLVGATKLRDALQASQALTIEAWITSSAVNQTGPARIVAFSQDAFPTGCNFLLGQAEDGIVARLRTTATDQYGRPALSASPVTLGPGPVHVVFTRDSSGVTKIYIDGSEVSAGSTTGTFASWETDDTLSLANEPQGNRPWLGTYYLVAIYDWALDPASVTVNYNHGPELCEPSPALITSLPVLDGFVGDPYEYDVEAVGCPEPEYVLNSGPAGMVIDPLTGLLTWTPDQPGLFPVSLEAVNSEGSDVHGFQILVTGPNPTGPYYISINGSDQTGNGTLATPFATIQHGIAVANPGEEVVALPGTFTGPGNRDIDFLGKAIIVRSYNSDPAECIIDCQGSLAEPHRGFIFQNDEGSDSVLMGFTITNGHVLDGAGGGILLEGHEPGEFQPEDGASPTVSNCRIVNNVGGGAVIRGILAEPSWDNCEFSGNTGFGVDLFYGAGRFSFCKFADNSDSGVNSWILGHSGRELEFIDCEFTDNGNFGLNSYYHFGKVILDHCLIEGNLNSGFEQMGSEYCDVVIRDSIIRNNVGLGLDTYRSWVNTQVTDSQVSGNGGQGLRLGIQSWALCFIDNCDILENGGNGLEISGDSFKKSENRMSPDVLPTNISNCRVGLNAGGGIIGTFKISNPFVVAGNLVFDNRGDGIDLTVSPGTGDPPTHLLIEGSTIVKNDGLGIFAETDTLTLNNNLVANNGMESVSLGTVAAMELACNDFYANSGGNWTGPLVGFLDLSGNISTPPLFCDLAANDFSLMSSSVCLPANQPVGEVCGPIGSQAEGCTFDGIYHVSESGSDITGTGTIAAPLATIQMALLLAADGDIVCLLPGTFTGVGNRDVDFLGKAVMVRSCDDDPAGTIIDCEGTPGDPHRAFLFRNNETGTSVLSGLTIRNGFADRGGAVMCGVYGDFGVTGSPLVQDCVFVDNQASGDGGAIFAYWSSSPDLVDCEFRGNAATNGGAVFMFWESSSEITSCLFELNNATQGGGAIAAQFEQYNTISGCRFLSNSADKGGAFFNPLGNSKKKAGSDRSTIRNADSFADCEFRLNSATSGGAVYDWYGSWHTFTNCGFDGNTAVVDGGAVFDYSNHNNYVGCLFANNEAGRGGALVILGDGDPEPYLPTEIISSTFFNNLAPVGSSVAYAEVGAYVFPISNAIFASGRVGEAIFVDGATAPVLNCVDIFGNEGGDWTGIIGPQLGSNGNIEADPIFCLGNNLENPYTLSDNSPCMPLNNPGCGLIGAFGEGCSLGFKEAPRIISITDVGNDQGRQIRLAWTRSGYDDPSATQPVTKYGIYRRQDSFKSVSDSGNDVQRLADWDFLMEVHSRGDEEYQTVVPTLCDSTIIAGQCWSVFMVSAATEDPFTFFDSDPDSGYSIDNLHPGPPVNFTVEYQSDRNFLSWNPSDSPDFSCFNIYRTREGEGLPELPGQPLASVTTLEWVDLLDQEAKSGWDYLYYLAAVDSAGNHSGLSSPVGVSDVVSGGLKHYGLSQNVPNPFNPKTAISFHLAKPARTTLDVFDLSGRMVKRLVNGDQLGVGPHQVIWNGKNESGMTVAAGVYFYHLKSGSFSQTRRMILLK